MDESRLPLTAHLAELRSRIFKMLIAWAAGATACWQLREQIFGLLMAPAVRALAPEEGVLQAIAPAEIFVAYLKCSLLGGFVIALPVLFWQAWAFIAPGLYPAEKKTALPFVLISTLLFVGGASFGHVFVFPLVYSFFANFGSESEFVRSAWTLREVLALTTQLFLAFGVGFELPVVIFFLIASGIVEPGRMLRGMKYGVLVAFVLGAVLTPPDVVSQILLAVPLSILYVLGVLAGWLFAQRRKRERAAETSVGS